MTTLNDTEDMRHTVVIQKAGRIIPIDHLVDTRPERVEKPHADKSPYIGRSMVIWALQTHKWAGQRERGIPSHREAHGSTSELRSSARGQLTTPSKEGSLLMTLCTFGSKQ